MERVGRSALCGGAAGAVTGSIGAVVRAATSDGVLAIYGWRGWLDLPLLAATGFVTGANVGAVVGAIVRRCAGPGPWRSGRRLAWTTAALLALAAAAFHVALARSDPTATPRRCTA